MQIIILGHMFIFHYHWYIYIYIYIYETRILKEWLARNREVWGRRFGAVLIVLVNMWRLESRYLWLFQQTDSKVACHGSWWIMSTHGSRCLQLEGQMSIIWLDLESWKNNWMNYSAEKVEYVLLTIFLDL